MNTLFTQAVTESTKVRGLREISVCLERNGPVFAGGVGASGFHSRVVEENMYLTVCVGK